MAQDEYPSDHWSNVEAQKILSIIELATERQTALTVLAAGLRLAHCNGALECTREIARKRGVN